MLMAWYVMKNRLPVDLHVQKRFSTTVFISEHGITDYYNAGRHHEVSRATVKLGFFRDFTVTS
jgi:hypothetical protein